MLNLATLLRLERPLAVLDLETTGLDPAVDRIIQIALTIHYVTREPIAWASLIDPEVPIANMQYHKITAADVVGKPTFKQVAPALAPKILHVDFAGYNVNFDIKFLQGEMKRCGVAWPWEGHVVDAFEIFKKRMPHNLGNAYKRFVDVKGFADAHDAGNDVAATEEVLAAQLQEFQDLPRTVKELADYCFPRNPDALDKDGKLVWNADGEACIAFGKHARNGPLPLRKLDRGYMQFILDNDFPSDVKEVIGAAMMGAFPKRT